MKSRALGVGSSGSGTSKTIFRHAGQSQAARYCASEVPWVSTVRGMALGSRRLRREGGPAYHDGDGLDLDPEDCDEDGID